MYPRFTSGATLIDTYDGVQWLATVITYENNEPNLMTFGRMWATSQEAKDAATRYIQNIYDEEAEREKKIRDAAPEMLKALQLYDQIMTHTWRSPERMVKEPQCEIAMDCWILVRNALAKAGIEVNK